jgi:site-specific recombinase XerC
MAVQTAAQLAEKLALLKQQRKSGELTLAAYYQELLHMVSMLSSSLAEEVHHMSEDEIAHQIPLMLLFLEEQIRKFQERS